MHETKQGDVLIIGAGKSKRLDAIRKKAGLTFDNDSQQTANKHYGLIEGLNPQTRDILIQAQKIIDNRLASIMKTYPAGKTKSFFKIKYGLNVEQLQLKTFKDIFTALKIDEAEIKQFRLIEHLGLHGKRVEQK